MTEKAKQQILMFYATSILKQERNKQQTLCNGLNYMLKVTSVWKKENKRAGLEGWFGAQAAPVVE